jgi:hypothetical protein
MGDGENDHAIAEQHERQAIRKSAEQLAPDSEPRWDIGPQWVGERSVADLVDRMLHLVEEVPSGARIRSGQSQAILASCTGSPMTRASAPAAAGYAPAR